MSGKKDKEVTAGGLYASCISGTAQPKMGRFTPRDSIVRIPPNSYVYVMDTNKNVTWLAAGPQRLTLQEGQELVLDVTPMLVVPPMHYVVIANPVLRDDRGAVLVDKHGQARLRYGDFEVRTHMEVPFPLYPGESVVDKVLPLRVLSCDQALRLRALRDFVDAGSTRRVAGDSWLFVGPGTYVPQPEVEVVELQRAIVLRPDEGLVLKARLEFRDGRGVSRKAGEMWLIRDVVGSYIPRVEEEVVRHVQAVVLTPRVALHLRAVCTFVDVYGIARKAGEEWLVTCANSERHIPDVNETVVKMVNIIGLTAREYCVIKDPWDAARKENQLGAKRLVEGPATFFLQPGESLESNIETAYLLGPEDALLVRAREEFVDHGTTRRPGSSWLVSGPRAYIPPTQVEVRAARKALVNLEAIGIYFGYWLGSYIDHPVRAP